MQGLGWQRIEVPRLYLDAVDEHVYRARGSARPHARWRAQCRHAARRDEKGLGAEAGHSHQRSEPEQVRRLERPPTRDFVFGEVTPHATSGALIELAIAGGIGTVHALRDDAQRVQDYGRTFELDGDRRGLVVEVNSQSARVIPERKDLEALSPPRKPGEAKRAVRA